MSNVYNSLTSAVNIPLHRQLAPHQYVIILIGGALVALFLLRFFLVSYVVI